MPIMDCTLDGKPGFKFGDAGTCYTHDGTDAGKLAAKKKAIKQALAIGGGKAPADLSDRELADALDLPDGIEVCTMDGTKGFRAKGDPPTACHIHDGSEAGMRSAMAKAVSDKRNPNGTIRNAAQRSFDDLETVNLDGVPLLAAGGPYFGTGSPPEGDTFDVAFLQELADAHNELRDEIKVPIKIGHSKAQRLLRNSGFAVDDEAPAAGWVENVRVAGEQLLGDLRSVPKKLADLIRTGAFRTRSVEMKPVKSQTQDGKEYGAVITALALLGAKAPAVRTLDDILAFYSEQEPNVERTAALIFEDQEGEGVRSVNFAEGDVIWSADTGADDWKNDLSAAINANAGPPSGSNLADMNRYWVQDIDQVNKRAIVCDYQSNTYWVVSFNIDEQGDPVPGPFSEWTLAEQAWVQAAPENMQLSEARRDTKAMTTTAEAPAQGATKLSDEQIAEFAKLFGIEEEDLDKRRAAVTDKFAEQVKEHTATETTTEEPKKTEPPAAETKAEGEGSSEPVSLSTTELAELKEKAEAGAKAYAETRANRIEANIDLALRQGRILPATKDKWRTFMERDYDLAVEQLIALPINPQLTRTFGSDDNGNDPQAKRAEADYKAYAEATGVPYEEAKT